MLLIRGSLQHFFTLVNKVSFTLVSTTGEGKQDFFALKGVGGGQISEKLNFVKWRDFTLLVIFLTEVFKSKKYLCLIPTLPMHRCLSYPEVSRKAVRE